MIYKNALVYNAAQLQHHDDGSVSWIRVPADVRESLSGEQGKRMAIGATGVELRFVLKGDRAVIRMAVSEDDGIFHVYRGGIQGGWEDHEVNKLVDTTVRDYVIKRAENPEQLKNMSRRIGLAWDSDVVRVIFDRGFFRIYDIQGDIEPPGAEQCPKKTLFCYGSSITHGSNAIDQSHAWASVLAHNLNVDVRNLGMAGSCIMEPKMVDYIASEGEKGHWDFATLELGINVLKWTEEKIYLRVTNTIQQVAGRNIDKPVFIISPFYHCGDDYQEGDRASIWRRCIEEIVKELNYPNVTYINGLDILDNMAYMSADGVHPNIYGVQRIADRLTRIIGDSLTRKAK